MSKLILPTKHWIFADDRTDILVKDKSPISIAKTDETGKTTVATLSNLPSAKQLYFGLEDKLQAIKNIKKEREKCDCGYLKSGSGSNFYSAYLSDFVWTTFFMAARRNRNG